jgi:hypothetical protein
MAALNPLGAEQAAPMANSVRAVGKAQQQAHVQQPARKARQPFVADERGEAASGANLNRQNIERNRRTTEAANARAADNNANQKQRIENVREANRARQQQAVRQPNQKQVADQVQLSQEAREKPQPQAEAPFAAKTPQAAEKGRNDGTGQVLNVLA